MRKKLYALYMDDELLGIGTIKALAEALGVKKGTIQYLATPSARRRGHKVLAYRVVDGE